MLYCKNPIIYWFINFVKDVLFMSILITITVITLAFSKKLEENTKDSLIIWIKLLIIMLTYSAAAILHSYVWSFPFKQSLIYVSFYFIRIMLNFFLSIVGVAFMKPERDHSIDKFFMLISLEFASISSIMVKIKQGFINFFFFAM